MRIVKTKAYTAAELKKLDGRAFNRALEKYREQIGMDGYESEEMMDSLKGLFDAASVKMRDWSLGAYNRGNMLRAEFSQDGAAELTGPRALAWIENNILARLRAPWGLNSTYTRSWRDAKTRGVFNIKDGRPVRRWTAPGAVPSCPFTGVCYDEDFLEDLIKSAKAGRTLKESFEDLADLFMHMLESEFEEQAKEEQFLDMAAANGWEYDEDGSMI